MATADVVTQYTFAEDSDAAGRRGWFDLAVDVFGADADPVVGAYPSRVAIEDALVQADRIEYVSYPTEEGESSVVTASLDDVLRDAASSGKELWVRSPNFLRVAELKEGGTARRQPAVDPGAYRDYEPLLAALQRSTDMEAQATYLGYLLQTLVGFRMADDPSAGKSAAKAVEDAAAELISTKTRIAGDVEKIMQTREKATSLETINEIRDQRDALLNAVGSVNRKLREEVVPAFDPNIAKDTVASLQSVRMVDKQGHWIASNFEPDHVYAGVISDTALLPEHGVVRMLQPEDGSTGDEEGDWTTLAPIRLDTFRDTIESPDPATPLEVRREQAQTMTDHALRMLNMLTGKPAAKEPGLLARMARERSVFGRGLVKVGKGVANQYNRVKSELAQVVEELDSAKHGLYSDSMRKDAVLLGARKGSGAWTPAAVEAARGRGYVLDERAPALAAPSAEDLPLRAPASAKAEDLVAAVTQVLRTMRRVHGDSAALEGAAAASTKATRTQLAATYETNFVNTFAGRQAGLQRDGFTSTSWYTDHQELWDAITGKHFDAADAAVFSNLSYDPNDTATPLGATDTATLIRILAEFPATTAVGTVDKQAVVLGEVTQLVERWFTSARTANNEAVRNVLINIVESTDAAKAGVKELIQSRASWNRTKDGKPLEFTTKRLGPSGQLVDVADPVKVPVDQITEWVAGKRGPLAVLALTKAYMEHVDGMLSNVAALANYCGKQEGGIYTAAASAKTAAELEKTKIRDEATAAKRILDLMVEAVVRKTQPEVHFIDLDVASSEKGRPSAKSAQFYDAQRGKRYSDVDWSEVGAGARLTIPPLWTEVTSLPDAADAIWSTLVEPRLVDNRAWFLAYANTNRAQQKAERELSDKTNEADALKKSNDTLLRTDSEKDNKLFTIGRELSAVKASESTCQTSLGRITTERDKLKTDIETCQRALTAKINEVDLEKQRLNRLFEEERTKLIREHVGTIGASKLEERALNLQITRAERDEAQFKAEEERLAKAGPGVKMSQTGEPWETALRAKLTVLEESKIECDAQLQQFDLFRGGASEYVRQMSGLVTHIVNGVTNQINMLIRSIQAQKPMFGATDEQRAAFEATYTPRLKNLYSLNNELKTLEGNVVHVDDAYDKIVGSMVAWATDQQKRIASRTAAEIAMGNALIRIFDLTANECQESITRQVDMEMENRRLEAQAERQRGEIERLANPATGIAADDVDTLRRQTETLANLVTALVFRIFQEYRLHVVSKDTIAAIDDARASEASKRFLRVTSTRLLEVMTARGKHASGETFQIVEITEFMRPDRLSSALHWEFVGSRDAPWDKQDLSKYRLVADFGRNPDGSFAIDPTDGVWLAVNMLITDKQLYRNSLDAVDVAAHQANEDLQRQMAEVEAANQTVASLETDLAKALRIQGESELKASNLEHFNKLLQQQLNACKANLTVMARVTKPLKKSQQALEAISGKSESDQVHSLKAIIKELTDVINGLQVSRARAEGQDFKSAVKAHKEEVAALKRMISALQVENTMVLKKAGSECANKIRDKDEEIKQMRARSVAALKDQLARVQAVHKEELKVAKDLASLEAQRAAGKATDAEIMKLKDVAERARSRMRKAERDATKIVEEAIRAKEVAIVKQREAEERLKTELAVAKRRKALEQQIDEIQHEERTLRERLRDDAERERNERLHERYEAVMRVRNEEERARAEQREAQVQAVIDELESTVTNQVNTLEMQLEECQDNFAEQSEIRRASELQLAFLESEMPRIQVVLGPIKRSIDQFDLIFDDLRAKYELARYGDIVLYGRTQGYAVASDAPRPFPPAPMIETQDTTDESGAVVAREPKLSAHNVVAIMEFIRSTIENALGNSEDVAGVWDSMREYIERARKEEESRELEKASQEVERRRSESRRRGRRRQKREIKETPRERSKSRSRPEATRRPALPPPPGGGGEEMEQEGPFVGAALSDSDSDEVANAFTTEEKDTSSAVSWGLFL